MRPQVCWHPSATIMQSKTHKRTLININPKEKTLYSSISNIICIVRLYYWKIRDLGSNFSHETAGLLASVATIKQSLIYNVPQLINVYKKRLPVVALVL